MSNILDLIGNTPLLKTNHLDTGICNLFLKLENQNPGGSIKDRIALSMINDAEKKGLIKPGDTLVEATAGNTGLGLALVARVKGYKLILVIPDKMSKEKIIHLRAMGAQVIMTRSDVLKGHVDYYQDRAERIAKETPGSYYINQFENPANPYAHKITTGPEIFDQLKGNVDAIVCGVGSGGTISGLTQFFKEIDHYTEMVLADPKGSVLAEFVKTQKIGQAGSWMVEGIGEDFIPPILDLSSVKKAYTISDKESMDTSRLLLEKEGVFAGSSSGTLVAAALKYCKEQKEPRNVVTFVCDTGNKYLNKFWDDHWYFREGFVSEPGSVSIAQLVKSFTSGGPYPSVDAGTSIYHTFKKMRLAGIDCIVVTENDEFAGIADTNRLIRAIKFGMQAHAPVSYCLAQNWTSVQVNDHVDRIRDILAIGNHPVLFDGEKLLGIVTTNDFLDFWKLQKR
jgi:cystathionine beta-synthase